MFHLIKKDLLIQKKNLLLSCVLIVFFLVTLSSIGTTGLTLSILAISYSLLLGASQMEDKNNSDRLLVSLPIKKSMIVLSKYISAYVFVLFAILVNFVFSVIIAQFEAGFEWLTVEGILGAIIAVSIFTSISLPLIFKWGYAKAKMSNYILFFAFVIGSVSFINNLDYYSTTRMMQYFSQLSTPAEVGITLLPLLLFLILSYFLSLAFYKKREF